MNSLLGKSWEIEKNECGTHLNIKSNKCQIINRGLECRALMTDLILLNAITPLRQEMNLSEYMGVRYVHNDYNNVYDVRLLNGRN